MRAVNENLGARVPSHDPTPVSAASRCTPEAAETGTTIRHGAQLCSQAPNHVIALGCMRTCSAGWWRIDRPSRPTSRLHAARNPCFSESPARARIRYPPHSGGMSIKTHDYCAVSTADFSPRLPRGGACIARSDFLQHRAAAMLIPLDAVLTRTLQKRAVSGKCPAAKPGRVLAVQRRAQKKFSGGHENAGQSSPMLSRRRTSPRRAAAITRAPGTGACSSVSVSPATSAR